MKKQRLKRIILILLCFSLCSCQEKEIRLTEMSDIEGRFKVSLPGSWIVSKDQESPSIRAEHPVLKEKYSISIQWNDYDGFSSNDEIDSFIKNYNEAVIGAGSLGTILILENRGCKENDFLQICSVDNTGVDIENDSFIATSYYITKKDQDNAHIEFSVRVSKKKFSEEENNLTEQILKSIVF